MSPALLIPGVIFFLSGLGIFVAYERLVKRQYEIARDAWEADGRPPGFAWAPQGTSVMRSWTRGSAMYRWTWTTPEWMRHDTMALSLQRRMRILGLVGFAAWLVLGFLMFFTDLGAPKP